MSTVVIAEFEHADALRAAARHARAKHYRILDGYSPFPVEGLDELLERAPSSTMLRLAMFLGGFGIAGCAYLMEWYSAVINYPINSGGRPLHSWPAFMLFPFSVGIFAAAVSGLIALFWQTGLPRLYDPRFALDGFERATQDRFLLELAPPTDPERRQRLVDELREAGALTIREVAI